MGQCKVKTSPCDKWNKGKIRNGNLGLRVRGKNRSGLLILIVYGKLEMTAVVIVYRNDYTGGDQKLFLPPLAFSLYPIHFLCALFHFHNHKTLIFMFSYQFFNFLFSFFLSFFKFIPFVFNTKPSRCKP